MHCIAFPRRLLFRWARVDIPVELIGTGHSEHGPAHRHADSEADCVTHRGNPLDLCYRRRPFSFLADEHCYGVNACRPKNRHPAYCDARRFWRELDCREARCICAYPEENFRFRCLLDPEPSAGSKPRSMHGSPPKSNAAARAREGSL